MTPSTTSPVWNSSDFWCDFFTGCQQINAYPTLPDLEIEFTPVDFAVAQIVAFAVNDEAWEQDCVRHIVNPQKIPYESVLEAIGAKSKQRSWSSWKKLLEEEMSHSRSVDALLAMVTDVELENWEYYAPVQFTNRLTAETLRSFDETPTKTLINETLIRKYTSALEVVATTVRNRDAAVASMV